MRADEPICIFLRTRADRTRVANVVGLQSGSFLVVEGHVTADALLHVVARRITETRPVEAFDSEKMLQLMEADL